MSSKVALLEAQLSQMQAEGARLRERAAVVLANVKKLDPAAALFAARWVDQATERLAALSFREAGPLWSGWDSPDWAHYSGDRTTSVLTHVRVGGLLDEEPLPEEKEEADLAWLLPLFAAEGAILVVCNNDTLATARGTIQSLVLRTALAMPSEARFTLIDPVGLGAAFAFRSDLMSRVRPTGRTVVDELGEIIDDIRRINERVIGHAARFSSLTRDQRAGETFELIAVVDFPKAYSKDPRAVEHIVRIGNAGPRAGRHLVVEVNLDSPLPHDFDLRQFERAVVVDVRSNEAKFDSPPQSRRQHDLLKTSTESGQQQRSGDWDSVVRPETLLSEDSSRRIETPMGERLRIWLGEGDGKHSSHAIIGGQTGSGKSLLLHVLITGLAARYGPSELQFVLIDGKNGIEFEVYRQLPQAEIICLRTLPAMARSVLADYVAEMEDRYRIFQAAGAVDLEGYRQRTGHSMPRKVLIADEYQQLLDGDEERGGLLLSRVLEKGRAAGTHVVLASQVFNVRGMPPNAFSHIETRASLALAPDYVQAIQLFGPEGKRLIRDLAPSGHVVINDRNGGDGSNSRGAVAQCNRKNGADTVLKVTDEVIAAVGRPGKPLVLNGRDAAVLTDNAFVMGRAGSPPDPLGLQEIARLSSRSGGFGLETWSAADRPIGLWLGRRFDVRGHALCALRRAPSQNLLVLGAHVDVRNRMIASALAALQAMVSMSSLELTLVDGLSADMPGGGMIRLACEQLAAAGAKWTTATEGNLEAVLGSLANSLTSPPDPARTRLLVIAEPDYLNALHSGQDRFAPPTSGPAAHLRTILSRGPQHGLHCVLSASGLAALGTVISPTREVRYFNHRAVQQMNEDESMTLFASLAAARIHVQTEHPFAALLVDQIQGVRAGVLFNSYAADPDLNAPQDLAVLRERLGALPRQEQANVA